MKASSLQVERTMYSLQLNSTGTRGVALANASRCVCIPNTGALLIFDPFANCSPGDLSCEIIISYPDPPCMLSDKHLRRGGSGYETSEIRAAVMRIAS